MAEIKSFKEYIEEQKLKENLIIENDEDELAPDISKKELENAKSNDKPISAKTNFPQLYVTKTKIDLSGKTQQGQIDELNKKIELLSDTYHDLDQYLTHKITRVDDDQQTRKESKFETLHLDITHGKSFPEEQEEWKKEFDIIRDNAKNTVERYNKIKDLGKKLPFRTQKRKEHEKEIYNSLMKDKSIPQKNKDDKEEKPIEDSIIFDKILLESPIDLIRRVKYRTTSNPLQPRLTNPFRTSSEISTGLGNRFSADRALSSLETKKKYRTGEAKSDATGSGTTRLYSDESVNNFLKDLNAKYQNAGRAIISKERKLGISYLNRARATIDKYLKYNRWIKDPTNYITNIATDVHRSLSIAQSIGGYIERLIQEYRNSLNSITDELKIREKKTKEANTDLNASSTLERAQNRLAKWGKSKEDDEVYRSGVEAEKEQEKQKSDIEISKRGQEKEEATQSDKLGIEKFFEFLKSHQPEDITKELLEKKIKKDLVTQKNGSNRTDLDKRSDLKATYLLAKYLENGRLKDFKFGEEATHTKQEEAGAQSLLNRLDNLEARNQSISGTAIAIKKALGINVDEESQHLKNKEAKDSLNTEATNYQKIKNFVEKKLISELEKAKENQITNIYLDDRIQRDINNSDQYYKAKDQDDDKLTAIERKKASAIISNIILYLIKNKLINKAIKQAKDGEIKSNLTFEPFDDSFKELKNAKDKDIDNYNNNLQKKFKIPASTAVKNAFKDALSQNHNKQDINKNGTDEAKGTGTYGKPAKDFDGETPEPSDEPQPKNIFDYAVQKAKKLQEK